MKYKVAPRLYESTLSSYVILSDKISGATKSEFPQVGI